MATQLSDAAPPQPSTAELNRTPPLKQEPQELTTNPPNHTLETHQPQQRKQIQNPHFINSVTELRGLSVALSAFHRRYDELQEHIDFIRTAINSKLPEHVAADVPIPPPPPQLAIIPATETLANSDQNKVDDTDNKRSGSELENLCEMMSSKGIRKYITSHLSNTAKLREEAPAALKRAPNPAKLVLECTGRFFLQGKRAYDKDSPMIPSRQASVLILEYYLLMGCDGVEIEREVKKEAETAALAWLKRLLNEGSLLDACEIDARGLLLFVGCFGIPRAFMNEDIMHLIRASNAREISDALRGSSFLVKRIPEIIELMVKKRMELEAVDTVYIFGVEDRSPPQAILNSFLRESKEALKITKGTTNGSLTELRDANKNHLADLKSVKKCLERHKIDHWKLLPEWTINENICILEKDIADLKKKINITDLKKKINEKVVSKRKVDETESSKKLRTTQETVKRSRFVGHADTNNNYESLAPKNLLDGGTHSRIYTYSASPSQRPYLPENAVGSVAGSGVGAAMSARAGGVQPTGSIDGVHGGIDRLGQLMNNNGRAYGSIDGVHREALVDRFGQVVNNDGRAYGSIDGVHGRVLVDRLGQVVSNNGQAYGSIDGVHGGVRVDQLGQVASHDVRVYESYGDAALQERLIGQGFADQPGPVGVNGLYRSAASLEGSFGWPNSSSASVVNRSSISDLYQFADVVERESYHSSGSQAVGSVPHAAPTHLYGSGSRAAETVPRVVPTHRSSYLY